ncbi:NmrA family NAD(P)-binding protein [Dyella psychrodurans]|uniref:NAD-dependent epimerase/dehydratase family protein n=1 Tax=Dyella psychrodurans TaxID=1927960 RepID=A0A370XEN8_9GAMM|nr:NmrA family NAD(P)-binding protein [Dyella psychrodurans]RDS86681.1 NAD-dependent epimerase/dehydratase family protein [Dyella psychrodurans]
MYAITGITGKVGSAMARALLNANQPVRAIVRDAEKGRAFAEKGCEVAIADMDDAASLTAAFRGAEGVFILPPSNFDPAPGFPEARQGAATIRQALSAAAPGRVVCLSTIGAQAKQPNLLTQRTILEEALTGLTMPLTVLRPSWFLDNLQWDVESAQRDGVIHSFLQPVDATFPMVSTEDVGRVAAELIQEQWAGTRIVELEGPRRVSANDIAAAFTRILGRTVRTEVVPREDWAGLFRAQGMNDPVPRIQMLDGFNEGWITFEGEDTSIRKGRVDLDQAVRALVEGAR